MSLEVRGEGDREGERGVRDSLSPNKQKVNTGGGNTVTLDAADRSSTCPLRFPRRPFCQPQDKSSTKSQHLSPPEALGHKSEGEKSDTTPLFADIKTCCILCLPPSLPRGNSTRQEMWLSANSLRSRQRIKSALLFPCFLLSRCHCGESCDTVISWSGLAQREWGISFCCASCVIQV